MPYDFRLSGDEKREILRIARATAGEFLRSGRMPPGKPHRRSLLAGGAAFVTMRSRAGALRGCVGTQSEETPLYRTVQDMSVAAATRDPRFTPVQAEELDTLVIEVSVLGDYLPVRAPEEVELGVHGLTVSCRGRRGLLLPQVAGDNRWTVEQFLGRVCVKAELPEDSWRQPDASIQRFTAQVFNESEFPPLDPQEILDQLMGKTA
jgi:hypothetical protein